jgi:hypothetical protein
MANVVQRGVCCKCCSKNRDEELEEEYKMKKTLSD